jgi:hypothetical protein
MFEHLVLGHPDFMRSARGGHALAHVYCEQRPERRLQGARRMIHDHELCVGAVDAPPERVLGTLPGKAPEKLVSIREYLDVHLEKPAVAILL